MRRSGAGDCTVGPQHPHRDHHHPSTPRSRTALLSSRDPRRTWGGEGQAGRPGPGGRGAGARAAGGGTGRLLGSEPGGSALTAPGWAPAAGPGGGSVAPHPSAAVAVPVRTSAWLLLVSKLINMSNLEVA